MNIKTILAKAVAYQNLADIAFYDCILDRISEKEIPQDILDKILHETEHLERYLVKQAEKYAQMLPDSSLPIDMLISTTIDNGCETR